MFYGSGRNRQAALPVASLLLRSYEGNTMIKIHIRRMELLVNRLAAVLRAPAPPPPRQLQSAQDVIDLLHEQVEALRAEAQASVVPKARALGYLAELARKAIETNSLATRLEALERTMKSGNEEKESG